MREVDIFRIHTKEELDEDFELRPGERAAASKAKDELLNSYDAVMSFPTLWFSRALDLFSDADYIWQYGEQARHSTGLSDFRVTCPQCDLHRSFIADYPRVVMVLAAWSLELLLKAVICKKDPGRFTLEALESDHIFGQKGHDLAYLFKQAFGLEEYKELSQNEKSMFEALTYAHVGAIYPALKGSGNRARAKDYTPVITNKQQWDVICCFFESIQNKVGFFYSCWQCDSKG